MDYVFNSQEELFNRVKPALEVKKRELKKLYNTDFEIDEIWNFLALNKWSKAKDLALSDIINDIMNVDNVKIIKEEVEHEEK